MRNYESHPAKGSNSLQEWWKVRNPIKLVFNYCALSLVKIIPSLAARRMLLRMAGAKVGSGAAVGLDAQFDVFFPEEIELGEDCIIGYGATILAHEFLIEEYRVGKVKIGRKAVVGANSTILCGVEIGENAVVGAGAVVAGDVPATCFVAGVPARIKKRS